MSNDNCQKIKLLKLVEMLSHDTDEDHPITTSEICRRLGEMGISCERRTVGKDVKVLREQGYEIMSELAGHENSYWIADRSFNLPELKILMDAVQASRSIPEDKTEQLISKIAALGGSHQAALLQGNIVRFNVRKHSNKSILLNVQAVEEAIQKRKKISFRYFDLNENLERVYRMERGRYHAEPVSLVYDDNNYYLLCYSHQFEHLVMYRLDKMDQVGVESDDLSDEARACIEDTGNTVKETFRMYLGETKSVTLRFLDRLIGVMYDRYGEDLSIRRIDNSTCEADVSVQISPTFWGWLMQYKNDVKLIAPEDVKEEYKKAILAVSETL